MYEGHYREMCPHAIGTKNGREQALFIQFGGSSSSAGEVTPDDAKWRCIPIGGLTQVDVQDGEWHTLDDHSQPQTCVGDIDLEVEY